MLRSGLISSLVCLAVLSALSAVFSGQLGVSSVLLVGFTVLAYFVSGQLTELFCLKMADWRGLLLLMQSLLVRLGVLGLVLMQLLSRPEWRVHINDGWFLAAGCVVVVSWMSGVVWADAHSRLPIYDHDYQPPANAELAP